MSVPSSREITPVAERTALLIIDVQKYCASPESEKFADGDYTYFFDALDRQVVPNIQRLLACFREGGHEIVYTMIESLTADGRDRSLDYKLSGLHVPKGGVGAEMLDPIRPQGDEIVIPKTSSSVFNSTNIDYVLRNLGVEFLIVTGILTDQCVESAVRDAADKGYLVTLATDACCTYSQARHDHSLAAITGYCRQRTTDAVVAEIAAQRRRSP